MRNETAVPRLAMLAGLIGTLACTQAGAAPSDSLATDQQRQAYSLGVAVAMQARQGLGDLDEAAFVAGVEDAMTEAEMALSPEQLEAALLRFDQRRMSEAEEEFAGRAETNRAEGEAFREKFATEENVVSLDNGLLYKVLDQGDGELPNEDSTVTVHYRANLVDGREFDSSYTRDEPVTFPLKGVMKGFSEALTRMREGAKWQVVIPPQLAYGEQGAGPIGPNSTLIFEVELISAS